MGIHKKSLMEESKNSNKSIHLINAENMIRSKMDSLEFHLIEYELLHEALDAFIGSLNSQEHINKIITHNKSFVIELNLLAAIDVDKLNKYVKTNFKKCNTYLLGFGTAQHSQSKSRYIYIQTNHDVRDLKIIKEEKTNVLLSRLNNELFPHIHEYKLKKTI